MNSWQYPLRPVIWSGLLIGLSALMTSPATASSSDPGFVSNPVATNANLIFYIQDGARTTPPTCATDPRYIIDPGGPGAASQYATLLTALALGRKVTVHGTGVCYVGTSSETTADIGISG